MSRRDYWKPYVSVAEQRAQAELEAKKLKKQGRKLNPIRIASHKIASTFWGIAWCDNLMLYADWANRMPRGRSYARNGSIIDLQIKEGKITSLVRGSSLYDIQITIDKLPSETWANIRQSCGQDIRSLIDLMRGKLPTNVLERLCNGQQGMFPSPEEVKISCSCPDYATLCKHAAATLYGVGHLLDSRPEIFFQLRGVDQNDLVSEALNHDPTAQLSSQDSATELAPEDLESIFGINLATVAPSTPANEEAAETRQKSKTNKKNVKAKPQSVKKSPSEKKAERKSVKKVALKKTPKSVAKKAATSAKKNVTKRMKNASSVGTPLYMPLQILKSEAYTSKCDIWATGFIFYEMLHGKTPWTAHTEF
jgi:uncharacterized Zn finger protein